MADALAEKFLKSYELDICAVTEGTECYSGADLVIIATPTDPLDGRLDTSSVESVIGQVTAVNPDAVIVIRSTVPIGFTDYAAKKYNTESILFCPEFLREGSALYDELNPSRIVVGFPQGSGSAEEKAHGFADLLLQGVEKKDVPVMVMNSSEAESVKLFSNTYLAMRIAFLSTGSAATCASVITTTTLPSATGDTVCRRIRGSFWASLTVCPMILSRRRSDPTYHERNI